MTESKEKELILAVDVDEARGTVVLTACEENKTIRVTLSKDHVHELTLALVKALEILTPTSN